MYIVVDMVITVLGMLYVIWLNDDNQQEALVLSDIAGQWLWNDPRWTR